MRLPRHFGRAKRMAHEQYCLGSAIYSTRVAPRLRWVLV